MGNIGTRLEILRVVVTGGTLKGAARQLEIGNTTLFRYMRGRKVPNQRFREALEDAKMWRKSLSAAEVEVFLAGVAAREDDPKLPALTLRDVRKRVGPVPSVADYARQRLAQDLGGDLVEVELEVGPEPEPERTEPTVLRDPACPEPGPSPATQQADVVHLPEREVVVPDLVAPPERSTPSTPPGPSVPVRSHKNFLDKVWRDWHNPNSTERMKIACQRTLSKHFDTAEKKRALVDIAEAQARGGTEQTSRGLTEEAKRKTIYAIIGPPPPDEPDEGAGVG
jgi:hypothetical protein